MTRLARDRVFVVYRPSLQRAVELLEATGADPEVVADLQAAMDALDPAPSEHRWAAQRRVLAWFDRIDPP